MNSKHLKGFQCGIYYIKNLKNRKIYVGQTSNFQRRNREHRSLLRRCLHSNRDLQNDFNNFSEESFVFTIAETCELDDLDNREKFWVTILDSTNPKLGYNICTGGEIGYCHSELTKEKMSKTHKERLSNGLSEETKLKISYSNTGRKVSKETLMKKSASCKTKVKVRLIDTDTIFDSVKDAARFICATHKKSDVVSAASCIRLCLKSLTRRAHGYRWEKV